MEVEIDKPKYQLVLDMIMSRINNGELKPGDPLPSLSQIMLQFDVSKITAQRVLRELRLSGRATVMPGNGAFVSQAPDSTREPVTIEIALILGPVMENHAIHLIRGLQQADAGIRVHLYLSGGDTQCEARLLQQVTDWGLDQVMISPMLNEEGEPVNEKALEHLADSGCRVVALGTSRGIRNGIHLNWNDHEAYGEITRRMHEHGARRLVFVSDMDREGVVRSRRDGFEQGARGTGLEAWRDHVLKLESGDATARGEMLRKALATLLNEDPMIDGLVCADLNIANAALGLERSLRGRRNLRLGGLGHHGAHAHDCGAEYVMAYYDSEALGRAAADLLGDENAMVRQLPTEIRVSRVVSV